MEGRGLQDQGRGCWEIRLPTELMVPGYSAHSALRAPSIGPVAVYWIVLFIILWIGFLMLKH